jgi:hypothetical protein
LKHGDLEDGDHEDASAVDQDDSDGDVVEIDTAGDLPPTIVRLELRHGRAGEGVADVLAIELALSTAIQGMIVKQEDAGQARNVTLGENELGSVRGNEQHPSKASTTCENIKFLDLRETEETMFREGKVVVSKRAWGKGLRAPREELGDG